MLAEDIFSVINNSLGSCKTFKGKKTLGFPFRYILAEKGRFCNDNLLLALAKSLKTCHLYASVECGEVPGSIKDESNVILKSVTGNIRQNCSVFPTACLVLFHASPKSDLLISRRTTTKPRVIFLSCMLPFQTVTKDLVSARGPRASSQLYNYVSIPWQDFMGEKSHPWLFLSPFNSFQLPPWVSSAGWA